MPAYRRAISSSPGVSRRGFLGTVGAGVIGAAVVGPLKAETTPEAVASSAQVTATFKVNGHRHRVAVEPRWSLLYVLRDQIGLTVTKLGCERGECGYCTPGQVMAAEGLLRQNPNPTLEEIRVGMSGNLCRCGSYAHIFKSVERAAELKRQEGGAK
jgi:xanthine dehydrogenase YagT iron-sulfur-binding subunit